MKSYEKLIIKKFLRRHCHQSPQSAEARNAHLGGEGLRRVSLISAGRDCGARIAS